MSTTEIIKTIAVPSIMEEDDNENMTEVGYYRLSTCIRVGDVWVTVEGHEHFTSKADADAAADRVKVEIF